MKQFGAPDEFKRQVRDGGQGLGRIELSGLRHHSRALSSGKERACSPSTVPCSVFHAPRACSSSRGLGLRGACVRAREVPALWVRAPAARARVSMTHPRCLQGLLPLVRAPPRFGLGASSAPPVQRKNRTAPCPDTARPSAREGPSGGGPVRIEPGAQPNCLKLQDTKATRT